MVSTLKLDEKYYRVRENFCFYLDIQDHELGRSLSRRIQDMGLKEEVFLTSRVSHVIRERSGAGAGSRPPCLLRDHRRASAMLERVRPDHTNTQQQQHNYITLTVQKAINLLDKLYDTFFTASRKSHVRLFTKHFIKIEFLDKLCRPVFKEFDEWPSISLEPDPPKEKEVSPDNPTTSNQVLKNTTGQIMTRKTRPRIKDKEEKEPKGGYCEMCNADYLDAALHRRSPHHLAFVRDHTNFLALDSLIGAGADVATFLDKTAAPINGERRSQRLCNGDADSPAKRSKRSQSPDSTVNGGRSPRRNGALDDEKKHNTRCSRKAPEDRQYYKVVGVSTKLRSSGNFTKKKESPPPPNGTEPLVVKFRKVRRSELSVLSDEAEQFMFPKRASSTSSTSSDDDDEKVLSPKRRTPTQPPPPSTERRRMARPGALKEESSEEDSWPEDKRRRKRPAVARRTKRVPCKTLELELPVEPEPVEQAEQAKQTEPAPAPAPDPEPEVTPLRVDADKCMKWEDGRLKYTPAVEQLEFAFESVPLSEPWFETFKRQDQDKVSTRNIPQYFSLYTSKAPKLPYEIGQLPPLKPNCCPLSDLVKREKPGPSRSYGTRGMKKQKIRKRTAAVMALESHPRKSPREHASTLAILGSAGLLNRRKLADDSKSTASEDTISDIHSNLKLESTVSEAQEASERLQQFLSEVFQDAAEFDVSDEFIEGDPAVVTYTNVPDVSSLVSECDNCDLLRNELKMVAERPRGRRGKFKKKNRTGWPNKRKVKKDSRTNSLESENKTESLDRSSAEPADDETTQDTISEEDTNMSETEDKTLTEKSLDSPPALKSDVSQETMDVDSSDKLLIDLKVVLDEKKADLDKEEKKRELEQEEKEKKKKRSLHGLCDWLQPVVRVSRVEASAARRLRSATRTRYR